MFGIYQVKVDAECKEGVKQTMHEVDKVEAVQRQQGKHNIAKAYWGNRVVRETGGRCRLLKAETDSGIDSMNRKHEVSQPKCCPFS